MMYSWTGSPVASPSQSRGGAGHARQRGFTLLEVLVAFTILVVTLTALLRVFSAGLDSIGVAERYANATMLARSILDEVGIEIPIIEGERYGVAGYGFTWTTRVARTASLAPVPDADLLQVPYNIEVDIAWEGSHLLTLTTLRIAPEGGTSGGFGDEVDAGGSEPSP